MIETETGKQQTDQQTEPTYNHFLWWLDNNVDSLYYLGASYSA